jgi:hypothetical protein
MPGSRQSARMKRIAVVLDSSSQASSVVRSLQTTYLFSPCRNSLHFNTSIAIRNLRNAKQREKNNLDLFRQNPSPEQTHNFSSSGEISNGLCPHSPISFAGRFIVVVKTCCTSLRPVPCEVFFILRRELPSSEVVRQSHPAETIPRIAVLQVMPYALSSFL